MRFWDDLGKIFETIIFVKFTLPILILIIIVMLIWQVFFGKSVDKEYKNDPNVILTSKFISTVCDTARSVYDPNIFSKVKGGDSNSNPVSTYSCEVVYYIKDTSKTAEEYEDICKSELTKIYHKLKGKKLVKDQIFADIESKSIGLVFYYPTSYKTYTEIDGVYYDHLCSAVLFYKEENGFDDGLYIEQLSNKILTDEHLKNLRK